MIFYFSGTGNSQHAARVISEIQNVKLVSIAKEFDKNNDILEYELKENELLGFVYPVYAWGPPKIVIDFIKRLRVIGGKPYVFSLCTCGDEDGNTTRVLQKALVKRDLTLNSAFSILMPNNYLVGFDVDSKDIEREKLENAGHKLKQINVVLTKRQSNVFHINPGKLPFLKSLIVNPLFNQFAMSTKKFYATDLCTSCGLCERICPVHTIKVKDKPVWSNRCTQCYACINRCPSRAIQYGKGTLQKGRYTHPDLK